jgi:phospholipase/carboxylesterase
LEKIGGTMAVVIRRSFLLALALLAAGCDMHAPWGGAPALVSARTGEAAGIRFVEIVTGGANASDTLPLVIAIHGFGGSPSHFLVRAELPSLAARARVVAPYGLQPVGKGFAWFTGDDDSKLAEDMRRVADQLSAMIAEVARTRPTAGKPIVTGFSQGGMLSYALAVLHPEVVRAAFPASGLLLEALRPSAWPAGKEMPRLHAFHGTADEMVPIDGDRATVRQLVAIGVPVELTEYRGEGHTLSSEMKRDLLGAITRELGR